MLNESGRMSGEGQAGDAPRCVWKRILMDNMEGVGTSFNPTNLLLSARRCLRCAGFSVECRSFLRMD